MSYRNSENNKIISKIQITEMCDICGKDCPVPIPRTIYLTKKGVPFIIRHHVYCDPIKYGQTYLEN
jgi:hypothetical protein